MIEAAGAGGRLRGASDRPEASWPSSKRCSAVERAAGRSRAAARRAARRSDRRALSGAEPQPAASKSGARCRCWSTSSRRSRRGGRCCELYEDVHWIDPSTLELLGLGGRADRSLPVLVLLTFRPEFSPPWPGQAHVTALPLSRLGRRQGAAMVCAGHRRQGAAGRGHRSDRGAHRRRAAVRRGADQDGAGIGSARPMPAITTSCPARCRRSRFPRPCTNSLMARLDRLAPVKEIAQIGAVIGREFSHELLAAVADRPEPELAPRSTSWSLPNSSSAAACRPRPPTASSTPWSRTPPIGRCSGPAPILHAGSRRCWRTGSRRSSGDSPSLSPITSGGAVSASAPQSTG